MGCLNDVRNEQLLFSVLSELVFTLFYNMTSKSLTTAAHILTTATKIARICVV
jgi:hypothetical protein